MKKVVENRGASFSAYYITTRGLNLQTSVTALSEAFSLQLLLAGGGSYLSLLELEPSSGAIQHLATLVSVSR